MFRNDLTIDRVRSIRSLLAATILLVAAAGCSAKRVTGPAKPVPLTLEAVGTGAAAQPGASTAVTGAPYAAVAQLDPLPVTFTKTLLVIRDVRFKIAEDIDDGLDDADDPADHDSTGMNEDDDDADEGDGMVIFRGPFVIDLLAQTAESLDTQLALPGDYRRVQGHLRELRADDWNASQFDILTGSTVYMEGTVDGEGGGPFIYRARIDDEFQIRGDFTVLADTPATAFIVFDVSLWLRGKDGNFLDPRVSENDQEIRSAIRHAIKVGMDDDHDGRFDDDTPAEAY